MNRTPGSERTDMMQAIAPKIYIMRPIERSDIDTVAEWYQHIDDISIFDRQNPLPSNREDVVKLVQSIVEDQEKEKCRWFVVEAQGGELVGMAALESINLLHGHAILPVFVAEPWRRTGVGIRMVGMILDIAFRQLRLHRVSTVYRVDNQATNTMIERCGFTKEGLARESWFSHGQFFDVMNVGILEADWDQIRPSLRATLKSTTVVNLGPRASSEWSWPGA